MLITGAILSVSLHGALTSAANAGYAWWTGEKYVRPTLKDALKQIRNSQLVHPAMSEINDTDNEPNEQNEPRGRTGMRLDIDWFSLKK